jgi:ParB family chromosome partitioning protein
LRALSGQFSHALFAAHQAGASRTRIRKAAGLTPGEVSAALAAATLDPQVRDNVAAVPRDLKLDELALVAEFAGDPDAVERLTRAAAWGRLEHEAELLRAERADLAEQQRQRTELEAAGVTITDDLPADARLLSHLRHDDADITPESHAGCPGHSVFFYSWAPAVANYYCADPAAYGHTPLWQAAPPGSTSGGGTRDEADAGAERAARRLVIAGNRAWKAAGEVRKRWVATFLSRRDRGGPPPAVARWVTSQLIVMPEPLRSGLPMAPVRDLFRELSGGPGASDLAGTARTVPAARLPLLMLTAIATAYEHAMTEGEQAKGTWRTGKYTTCPREQAGEYLSFLAGLGYQLSSIEQALADGVAWTGDTAPDADPGEPADTTTAAGTPDAAEDTGALATAGEDHPGDENSPDQDTSGMSSGDLHEAEPAAAVDQPPCD